MKIVALNCNNCGAPLEVPRKVQFFTCSYCSSHLKIEHSGGAIYSEIIKKLDQRTEEIVDELEAIKIERSIEKLDREWKEQTGRYEVRGSTGENSIKRSWIAFLCAALHAIGGLVSYYKIGFNPLTNMLWIGAFGFGLMGIYASKEFRKYKRALRAYRKERRRLMSKKSR